MANESFQLPKDHPAARFETTAEGLSEEQILNTSRKSRAGVSPRSSVKRSADIARISALLLQGASPEDIATELGMSLRTLNSDLKHLNHLWMNQIAENNEQFRAVILSKLMKLEALALDGYAESKEKTVTDHTTHPDGSVSRSVKKFHTAGDSAFLNVAKDCIKQQVTVLGLDSSQSNVKVFDKDAFLDAVAEKIAEAKLAATSVPAVTKELRQVEKEARDAGCPF